MSRVCQLFRLVEMLCNRVEDLESLKSRVEELERQVRILESGHA